MASGLPIVSTRHAGIPYAVTDEVGALVPERDSTSLARELIRLLSDSHLARAMGAAGRVRAAAEFDLQRQVPRLEEMYFELGEEHRSLHS